MSISRQVGAIAVSITVVFGFFLTLGLLITRTVAPNQLLDGVIGALTLQFGGVCYYWIGSTSGSQAKDQHIADMIKATNASE